MSTKRAYSKQGVHCRVTPEIWLSVFEDPYLTDTLCLAPTTDYQAKLPAIGRMFLESAMLLNELPLIGAYVHYLKMMELLDSTINEEVTDCFNDDIQHEITMVFYKAYTRQSVPRIKGIMLPNLLE